MSDTFVYEANRNDLSWNCNLRLIKRNGSYYEAILEGRGSSFHVIAGPQIHGMFLCIPNWQIGCELASLKDTFWNSEQLRPHLNIIDTQTVVSGLACLPEIFSDNKQHLVKAVC